MPGHTARSEFERQLGNLVAKGYPDLAGLDEAAFLKHVSPLGKKLPEMNDGARISFVIVIRSELVPTERAMPRVELNGKEGFVGMYPTGPTEYGATDDVRIPEGSAYLVADVDTGAETRNVTPDDAIDTIRSAGRSPLTIDEGVAVLTHFPDVLETRNAFSILGSRRGDRRVPAMWISGGKPRLGWCWAGNPHTWLGSASCGSRIGA
jgi:hypothetical protein